MRAIPLVVILLVAPTLAAGCLGDVPGLPGRGSAGAEDKPLTVSLTAPDAVRVGDEATFTASAPDVPDGRAFWFWDFGDGRERKGVGLNSVTHAFTRPGAYDVSVTVVDADGRYGTADAGVGAGQAYTFEGTVSSLEVVGSREYAAAFPVREGLVFLHVNLTLERPSAAFRVLEPTPPEVWVRVRAPDTVGAGDGDRVLFERRLTVEDDGTHLTTSLPGALVTADGDAVLRLTAEDGTTHFQATLDAAYG